MRYLLCEWNPVHGKYASIPRSSGDCTQRATLRVAIGSAYPADLLCPDCAAKPRFDRCKYREPLTDTP